MPKLKKATLIAAVLFLAYILSSGPVLAVAFVLRESTGYDGFYAVMWLYYPLLISPRWIWDGYISWWVELFGTVGPG
jgi:hypothetical protein